MIYIDTKYLADISSSLKLFKKKGDFLYNFRCPFCLDSQKKSNKSRGYIYRRNNELQFKCHNCSRSYSFATFLKMLDVTTYKKYMMEKFRDDKSGEGNPIVLKTTTTAAERFSSTVKTHEQIKLPKILDLPEDHWVRQYVKGREIPFEHFDKIFFADDFKKFISDSFGQDKANSLINNEPRLVIPFFNQNKEIIAVQGRSLLNNKLRYITIKTKEEPKIFGLDRLNPESKVYIVEGPLDSLFLKNCIAAGGAELSTVVAKYTNAVCIFDNEPWNEEIVKLMKDVIKAGSSIVIWPRTIKEKDINDMVKAGINVEEVIEENTFSSLEARAKLVFWRV